MSWGVSLWIYPVWDSLGFLDLSGHFLPYFREVFKYYLLKYFLMVFLFVFFFWDSYDLNVGAFDIVPEVSEVVLISFNSSLFFSFLLHLLPPFYLPPHLSYFCLSYSVGFLPECFLSQLLHYSLLIKSFLFLLGLYIFSVLVSGLFISNSTLFSRFWIIFTVIILNYFSGRLPISSSLVWFGTDG